MNPTAPGQAPLVCSSPPFPAPAPERGRVLYVDDDPTARMVFAHWLERNGYEHEIATGPAEASGLLACTSFDIVLSDICMPGNTRLEWVEQVLAAPGAPAVLLLTGTPEFETACRAANLAVAGYLLKPADFTRLDETLQRIIRERNRQACVQDLAQDILRLARERPALLADHHHRLDLLARALDARLGARDGDIPPDDSSWRAAVADAIVVIEQTRHSFRSRELGQLRARLQRLLEPIPAPPLR